MQHYGFNYRSAAVLLALLISAARPALAQQQVPEALSADVVKVTSRRSTLQISEKFSKVLEFENRVSRVDGFDPSVINVTALSPQRLRVQASVQGVTTVIVTDEQGQTFSIEVFVSGDARLLQSVIDRMFPNTSVIATKVQDAVLLTGWITEPQQVSQIVELAELYFPRVLNQLQQGGPQQVQLRVKVMEVQRSKIRNLGFNWTYLSRSVALASTPGGLAPVASLALPFGGPPALDVRQTALSDTSMLLGVVSNDNVFQGFLDALREEGLLKIQAEPVLVTRNGQPAKLLNGGEFPILVPQSLGTVTVEWREFGVKLESVPIVVGHNRVKQQLIAEVSERDFANSVSVEGTTVPGLTKRRVETEVEMNFGETLVIGGLISSRKTAETSKIPILGEMPWIGAAFRRVRYDEVETELLVLVTPEYVAPYPAGEAPAGGPGLNTDTPTDRELFLDGVIEVPSYGGECVGCETIEPHVGPAGGLQPTPAGALEESQLYAPPPSPAEKPAAADTPAPPPEAEAGRQTPQAREGLLKPAQGAADGARAGLIEPKEGLVGPFAP